MRDYDKAKELENLIRDMLFDIPVIPDRYKYVGRLKQIIKGVENVYRDRLS